MPETPDKLAAADAAWHLRQAADFFGESANEHKSARAKLTARNRFLKAAKRALPFYGIEPFWQEFKRLNRSHWGSCYEPVAEAAVRELWADLEREQKTTARQVLESALKALGGAA